MRLNTSLVKKVKKYFLVYIFCLHITSCADIKKQEQQGYELSTPVILALTKYYQANKQYPKNLEALIPGYIKNMPRHPNGNYLEYRLTKNGLSYELSFATEGRGIGGCTYTPETKWECGGYM